MSYTKGPWKQGARGPNNCPIIGSTKVVMLAMLTTGEGFEKESEANANLIAAAPELLEALKKAKEFISNGIEFGFIRMPDEGDSAHETLPIILRAIKKAEGRTT